MIVEQRIYTLIPGKVQEYLANYAREGAQIQIGHLGNMLGYYFTEVGPLNVVMHMWAYENAADREARRAKMLADPAWQAYIKKAQALVQSQESRILRPAPFFTDKLAAMVKGANAVAVST
jgi:hypothetical protein